MIFIKAPLTQNVLIFWESLLIFSSSGRVRSNEGPIAHLARYRYWFDSALSLTPTTLKTKRCLGNFSFLVNTVQVLSFVVRGWMLFENLLKQEWIKINRYNITRRAEVVDVPSLEKSVGILKITFSFNFFSNLTKSFFALILPVSTAQFLVRKTKGQNKRVSGYSGR